MLIDKEYFKSLKLGETDDPEERITDCIDECLKEDACVVSAVDHELSLCYLQNSTDGELAQYDGWSTMIVTQPLQILQGRWFYTRHSRLQPEFEGDQIISSSSQDDFLLCVQVCLKCPNSSGLTANNWGAISVLREQARV